MYVEHNDSEDPNRDWELSVEFYSDEQAEYTFFVSQGEVEVRAEVPQQAQQARGRKTRPGKQLHKRMLQRTCY
jgi:hypothetical protein